MSGALSVIASLSSSNPSPTLYYDASNTVSYPGSGDQLFNAGIGGTMTGTAVAGINYVSTGPKYINMPGYSPIRFPAFNFGSYLTASIWLRAGTGGSCQTWMANGNAGPNPGFRFFWNSWTTYDHFLVMEGGSSTTAGGDNSGVAVIVPGTWQYITYVWNLGASEYRMYNNATLVRGGVTNAPTNTIMTGRAWSIGEMTDSSYAMVGDIGYIKVWRYATLTQAQIQADFESSRARFGV